MAPKSVKGEGIKERILRFVAQFLSPPPPVAVSPSQPFPHLSQSGDCAQHVSSYLFAQPVAFIFFFTVLVVPFPPSQPFPHLSLFPPSQPFPICLMMAIVVLGLHPPPTITTSVCRTCHWPYNSEQPISKQHIYCYGPIKYVWHPSQ